MSIINHSTTNINFAESTDVHVFPSAFRGAGFDPESRTQTERNFSHIGGAAPEQYTSYLIAFDKPAEDSSGYCEFVLGGYYFKVSLSGNDWSKTGGICTNKAIYAGIKITGYNLYSSTNAAVLDSVKTSTRLKNLTSESEDSDNNLDINYTPAGGTATTLFTGLGFYEEAQTGDGCYCLQLTNADGTIHHDYNFFKNYRSIDELKDKDGKINNKTSSITMLDVMASMATNSFLFSSLGTYTQLAPNNDYTQGTLEVWKSDSSYIIARYTAKKTNTEADANCRIWYGETQLDASEALIWSGWKEIINAEDNQTISGQKTFTTTVKLDGGSDGSADLAVYNKEIPNVNAILVNDQFSTAPSTDRLAQYSARDGAGKYEGGVRIQHTINNQIKTQLISAHPGAQSAEEVPIGSWISLEADPQNSETPDITGWNQVGKARLLPGGNKALDLGSTNNAWRTLYAENIDASTILGSSTIATETRKISDIFVANSNAVKRSLAKTDILHITYTIVNNYIATFAGFTLSTGAFLTVQVAADKGSTSEATLSINGATAKTIYLNGTKTSTSVKLAANTAYNAYYNGTNWYFTSIGTVIGGGTQVTLNNANKASTTATIYAPTTGAGTKKKAGQVLLSGGNNQTTAPTWSNGALGGQDNPLYLNDDGVLSAGYFIPKLNGSNQSSAANFYAPTTQISANDSKAYLVGASASDSLDTVYSNANAYMQSGLLYSEGQQVSTISGIFAECTTAADTAKKTALLPGYTLSALQRYILLKVTNTNTASGITLNINSTGDKSIWINGAIWSSTNQLAAGYYLANWNNSDTRWELTKLYLPIAGAGSNEKAGQVLLSGGDNETSFPVWSNSAIGADTTFVYINSDGVLTATTKGLGSSTKPLYLSSGTLTECSTYAGGTAVTLNGDGKGANTASFYAPTDAGSGDGYFLRSKTSASDNTPSWTNVIDGGTI